MSAMRTQQESAGSSQQEAAGSSQQEAASDWAWGDDEGWSPVGVSASSTPHRGSGRPQGLGSRQDGQGLATPRQALGTRGAGGQVWGTPLQGRSVGRQQGGSDSPAPPRSGLGGRRAAAREAAAEDGEGGGWGWEGGDEWPTEAPGKTGGDADKAGVAGVAAVVAVAPRGEAGAGAAAALPTGRSAGHEAASGSKGAPAVAGGFAARGSSTQQPQQSQQSQQQLYYSASEDEDFVAGVARGALGPLLPRQPEPRSNSKSGAKAGNTRVAATAAAFDRLRLQQEGAQQQGSAQGGPEVQGVSLKRHPGRLVQVPLLQPLPVYTEDRLAERRAAARGLEEAGVDAGVGGRVRGGEGKQKGGSRRSAGRLREAWRRRVRMQAGSDVVLSSCAGSNATQRLFGSRGCAARGHRCSFSLPALDLTCPAPFYLLHCMFVLMQALMRCSGWCMVTCCLWPCLPSRPPTPGQCWRTL